MNSSCSALDMDAQGLYSLLRNIFKIRLIMFFMMADKKAKFIGIFANIPEKIREEDIIVVVDNNPFTWNSAVIEVKNNSETGKKILKNMEKMGLL